MGNPSYNKNNHREGFIEDGMRIKPKEIIGSRQWMKEQKLKCI
jgi:hypothetical protein